MPLASATFFCLGSVLLSPESLQKYRSSAGLFAGTHERRKTSICLSSGQAIPVVRRAPVLLLVLPSAAVVSAQAGLFLFADIFIQALADGTTAIRLGRGRNGAVVQGTTGGAAADRYCLRGFFAGRKKVMTTPEARSHDQKIDAVPTSRRSRSCPPG